MAWIVRCVLVLAIAPLLVGCGTIARLRGEHAANRLQDHITAVQLGIFKAACVGVEVYNGPDQTSTSKPLALALPLAATFTIQTTFSLSLSNAPAGAIPVDASGSAEHQGTVAVTVPFKVPTPGEEACTKAKNLVDEWQKQIKDEKEEPKTNPCPVCR
jgi:hypothetical protein